MNASTTGLDATRPLMRLGGGAVVLYGHMRAYATWPLAVLEGSPGRVKLAVTLLRLLGGDTLDTGQLR